MSRIDRILVPADGSESSSQAIEFALKLARRYGAEIEFCHSVDLTAAIAGCNNPYAVSDVSPLLAALEDESKSLLSRAGAAAAAVGVRNTTVELAGPPAGAILDLLRHERAELVVMGTHGRSGVGRFILGSTADGVLRQADVPVIVVSDDVTAASAGEAPFACIVIALDDSEPADAALDCALDLAVPGETGILLAHSIDVRRTYELAASQRYALGAALAEERAAAGTMLSRAAAHAKDRGFEAETIVLSGTPSKALLDLARSRNADLVAIGTHGRRGIRRWLLGSVAESVLHSARVPILVVRHRLRPTLDHGSQGT